MNERFEITLKRTTTLCARVRCMASNADEPGPGTGTAVDELVRTDVKEPKPYAVLLHNDDYTTMEFVIEVLKRFVNTAVLYQVISQQVVC